MTNPSKEEIEAAVQKIANDVAPKIESAKATIETKAQTNVWPLLAGALVIGAVVGSVLVLLLA
jgi:hypothetical protein